MYHHGPSNIQNIPVFTFINSICWDVGCLMNNSIFFEQKTDTTFLIYSKALSVRSTRIKVKNYFFILLKSSITLKTFDLSFSKYNQVI